MREQNILDNMLGAVNDSWHQRVHKQSMREQNVLDNMLGAVKDS